MADHAAGGPDVEIAGTFNARDAGGWPTQGGAVMRTGVLYRAASLDRIDAAGRADLLRLGVRTVADLRSGSEIDRAGRFDPSDTGIAWRHLESDFGPPNADPERMAEVLVDDDPMAGLYVRMLDEGMPMFREGLRLLAEDDSTPLLIHCTSGKDRTGLFALFVQLICGVDVETAMLDYERSGAAMGGIHDDMEERYPEMSAAGVEKLRRMADVDRRWVEGALGSIGGVDGVADWLTSIGVTLEHQEAIRGRFL
ncbi:MAG: tyrosine-protein phosphatase [Actinomycetota bacterium]